MEQGVQHGHRGRESGATVDTYVLHKGYYSKRWPRRAQWPYGGCFCFFCELLLLLRGVPQVQDGTKVIK